MSGHHNAGLTEIPRTVHHTDRRCNCPATGGMPQTSQ